MTNLLLIRGFEIDIPKTMLQHRITNIIDLGNHLKKLLKITKSFQLLIIKINGLDNNDQYKMYITNKFITKSNNRRVFNSSDSFDLENFFVQPKITYGVTRQYHGREKQFIAKIEENKCYYVIKSEEYSIMYDLYDDILVY